MAGIRRRLLPGSVTGRTASVPPRLTFVFFAIPFQLLAESLYWVFGIGGNRFVISFTVALWVVWFLLILLVALPAVDRRLQLHSRVLHQGAVAIIILLALLGIGEVVGVHLMQQGSTRHIEVTNGLADHFRYNDATALGHQASEMLLKGENPYTTADIVGALEELHLPPTTVTPLKKGDFAEVFPYPTEDQIDEVMDEARTGDKQPEEIESKISYPAGSFLFQTPFIALGLDDLRLFYLLCAIAAGLFVFWRAPARLRPVVAIAFLSNIMLWNMVATGTVDTLYVLFVLLGWILRPRVWLAAIFMGLAASTKQIAWLYVFFYLILVLRETGWRPALQSLGVIAAIFSAVNLPFIFGAPQHWMEGVMAPVLDPMFPRGAGIVAFSAVGILPPNALMFTVMEITALLLAAAWYYRTGYRYPQVGLLLAVVPFFFAWRSYSCYFYFASILVFGAVATLEYTRSLRHSALESRTIPEPAS